MWYECGMNTVDLNPDGKNPIDLAGISGYNGREVIYLKNAINATDQDAQ